MPVIAAGVVNKEGHIILSRSFREISRIRIEGLLSAFPRLLESSVNKQVTYIDAGVVRYVYQPLEELFLVLITTKSSNIVEDLETLHLMGRLIREYVDAVTETALESNAFSILFALDEVIVGGRREITTVEQIRTYLEMDSHEEMMVREEKRLQMERAKKDASRKAHELREKRRQGINPYSGIDSSDAGYAGIGSAAAPGMMGVEQAGVMRAGYNTAGGASPPSMSSAATAAAPKRAGGLTLGQARKADITSRVLKEAGLGSPSGTAPPPPAAAAINQNVGVHEGNMEGLHVVVTEKISAKLNRDGEGGAVDVRGELSVLVSDPQLANVRLMLSPMTSEFSFRAHAKVNKEIFAQDHVLAMRDNKPLPLQQTVTILRWRLLNPEGVRPPFVLSCWPGTGSITVEYELNTENAVVDALHNIRIVFPLYGARAGDITPSVGTWSIANGCVVWSIPLVDPHTNASGNVEIELENGGEGAAAGSEVFFPVDVNFTAQSTFAKVRVVEAVQIESGTPVQLSQESHLIAESYMVEG